MTTPCDGNCQCPEPCADCVGAPSLPPFARGLPFVASLREGTVLSHAAHADAGAEHPQAPEVVPSPSSTATRLERGRR